MHVSTNTGSEMGFYSSIRSELDLYSLSSTFQSDLKILLNISYTRKEQELAALTTELASLKPEEGKAIALGISSINGITNERKIDNFHKSLQHINQTISSITKIKELATLAWQIDSLGDRNLSNALEASISKFRETAVLLSVIIKTFKGAYSIYGEIPIIYQTDYASKIGLKVNTEVGILDFSSNHNELIENALIKNLRPYVGIVYNWVQIDEDVPLQSMPESTKYIKHFYTVLHSRYVRR